MPSIEAARPPFPAAAWPDRAWRFGAWAGVAALAGAAAAWGAAGALLVLGALVLGGVLALLGTPLPFLWIIVATSGLGFGWLDAEALRVAGYTINVNGLRWGIVVLVTAAVLVREGRPALPRHFRGYATFVVLAALGILWTPSWFEGLKHVLQVAAPLLVALVALRAIRSADDAATIRSAFWIGLIMAAGVGLTLGVIGLGGGRDLGDGRLLHQATGLYLLPLMALGLAAWRCRGGAYAIVPAIIFTLGLITLSRTTVVVMLGLIVLSAWGRPLRWYVGVALSVALVATLALQYEPFRDRVLGTEDGGGGGGGPAVSIRGTGQGAELVIAGVSLTGRGLVWLQTARHGAEAPVLGHGTGSAVHFLETVIAAEGVIHPHNDYLRVFHDLGLVGLAVFLVALWILARHLHRLHRDAPDTRARERALAGGLALAAYLGAVMFDNALVYPVAFSQNLFLILVLAGGPGEAAEAEARA